MKYIRTKDGIFEVEKLNLDKIVGAIQYHILDNSLIKRMYGFETHMYKYKILAQTNTIEELFMPNDLLVVGDDKNQMPIFIESIEYLKAWLYCHDIYKIKEFYIKNGNDFKCVAKANDKGELKLI